MQSINGHVKAVPYEYSFIPRDAGKEGKGGKGFIVDRFAQGCRVKVHYLYLASTTAALCVKEVQMFNLSLNSNRH